jgi:predicted RNase H-like HicB family nuclease
VLIEPLGAEDGGGFVATVPDQPGCMSDGETPQDALANMRDATAAWIEEARAWADCAETAAAPCGGRMTVVLGLRREVA